MNYIVANKKTKDFHQTEFTSELRTLHIKQRRGETLLESESEKLERAKKYRANTHFSYKATKDSDRVRYSKDVTIKKENDETIPLFTITEFLINHPIIRLKNSITRTGISREFRSLIVLDYDLPFTEERLEAIFNKLAIFNIPLPRYLIINNAINPNKPLDDQHHFQLQWELEDPFYAYDWEYCMMKECYLDLLANFACEFGADFNFKGVWCKMPHCRMTLEDGSLMLTTRVINDRLVRQSDFASLTYKGLYRPRKNITREERAKNAIDLFGFNYLNLNTYEDSDDEIVIDYNVIGDSLVNLTPVERAEILRNVENRDFCNKCVSYSQQKDNQINFPLKSDTKIKENINIPVRDLGKTKKIEEKFIDPTSYTQKNPKNPNYVRAKDRKYEYTDSRNVYAFMRIRVVSWAWMVRHGDKITKDEMVNLFADLEIESLRYNRKTSIEEMEKIEASVNAIYYDIVNNYKRELALLLIREGYTDEQRYYSLLKRQIQVISNKMFILTCNADNKKELQQLTRHHSILTHGKAVTADTYRTWVRELNPNRKEYNSSLFGMLNTLREYLEFFPETDEYYEEVLKCLKVINELLKKNFNKIEHKDVFFINSICYIIIRLIEEISNRGDPYFILKESHRE